MAFRSDLRGDSADGKHSASRANAAQWRRRDAVREHICGLRWTVGPDEEVPGRTDRDPRRAIRVRPECAGQLAPGDRRSSGLGTQAAVRQRGDDIAYRWIAA